jgi:hypothetical protein
MICSKCSIDKPETDYKSYFHSTQNKWRTRKICTTCFNKQKIEYRESIRNKKIIQPVEDMNPTIEVLPPPIDYSNNPNYKKCTSCGDWKTIDRYYFHNKSKGTRFSDCCICHKEKDQKERQEYLQENGGSERVLRSPNSYTDEYQKEQTFTYMKVLGYTYNEEVGIWTKPGVKELIDGKIVFPKVKKLKRVGIYETKVNFEMIKKIVEYKKRGWNNEKIGDMLDISDTSVFKYYKRWKDILK